MLIRPFRTLAVIAALTLVGCGDAGTSRTDGSAVQDFRVEQLSRAEEAIARRQAAAGRGGVGAAFGTEASSAPAAPPMPERDFSGNPKMAEGSQSRDPSQVRAGTADTVAVQSMIIRTGDAQLEVDSLEIAMQQVRDLAQRLGGVIANTQLASGRDQIRTATLQMRIPSARWIDALSGLRPIGKVESLNEYTEDVGEEYVDVTARVENARRLERRLIELLGNRTGRLSDVLAVERELARVREEIERYEGRLRYLRNRVQLSTLTVTVHEAYPVVSARGETGVLGDAFKQAWRNFVGFIAGIISLTGILIPLAALGLVIWILWRRWRSRQPPPPPHRSTASD